MRKSVLATTGILLLLTSETAFAASCSGVPVRVAIRTRQLENAVKDRIVSVETALVTQERSERDRLLAALQVVTKQESASSGQTAQMMQDAQTAQASTYVAQRQNLATLSARERYASVGFDPCSLATKASGFYQASIAAPELGKSISTLDTFSPGAYGDPKAWTQLVKNSGTFSAGSLFSGDVSEARQYISVILGPSEKENNSISNRAEGQLAILDKNYKDAHKSVVATVLGSVAAENTPGSVREKALELTKHWIGDDGGAAWAANSSDQQLRGVLQDAVRIEAANIAALAQRIKTMNRSELAAASLLLSLVNDQIAKPDRRENRPGNQVKASLER